MSSPSVSVGDRVRLVSCADPYTVLEPGLEGVVRFVDDVGTTHVQWDDGHTLGLVPDHDEWELVDAPPAPEPICDGTYYQHHPTAAGDVCRRCGERLR